jgi:CRP-like cAMP-binding protein
MLNGQANTVSSPQPLHGGVFSELLELEDRQFLVKNSLVYQASPGTILCHQHSVDKVLYVILYGEVEVSEDVQGQKVPLGTLKSGDIFGEIAALFTVPRIATVTATKPTVVLEIPADKFASLIDRVPNLREAVYQRLYERSLETALRSMPHFGKLSGKPPVDLSTMLRCWKIAQMN